MYDKIGYKKESVFRRITTFNWLMHFEFESGEKSKYSHIEIYRFTKQL